jgi:hypothetical protein
VPLHVGPGAIWTPRLLDAAGGVRASPLWDCEDFALWTWRQLMQLGYSSRFVCGYGGRYGAGHAWVTCERDGRTFIIEALAASAGQTFPRLATLRYKPSFSVAWDGAALRYFEHTESGRQVSFVDVAPHIPEWARFWIRTRPTVWANRMRWLAGALAASWPQRK